VRSSATRLPTPGGPGSVSGAPAVVITDTGHGVAERAPEELLAALTEFPAPYRENGGRLR